MKRKHKEKDREKDIEELLREYGIESRDTTDEHIGEATIIFFRHRPAFFPKLDKDIGDDEEPQT